MKVKDRLYFVVFKYKDREEDDWEYMWDSQGKPQMYRSLEQLKKYLYKFRGDSKEYRVAEYKLNEELISFDNIDSIQED